jgi:hypothetical protein
MRGYYILIKKERVMKKIIGLGLVLFFATNVSVAGTLSLQNDLSGGRGNAWPIDCQITYKNGEIKNFVINQGEEGELGEVNSIAKIYVAAHLLHRSFFGKASPIIFVADTAKGWDNLTDQFLQVIRGHENDDFSLKVEWKYPDSYTSREWSYTFENRSSLHKFKFGSLNE